MNAYRGDMTAEPLNAERRRRAPLRLAPILSWVFVVATVGFLGFFAHQLGMFDSPAPENPQAGARPVSSDQVIVASSKITGFDNDKQPFSLDSASAVQDPKNPEIVNLTKVRAELQKLSGEVLSIRASKARYDSASKMVDLSGNVEIVSHDRFVAKMDKAVVTMKNKRLYTEVPVTVTLSGGEIRANGLEIRDNGQDVRFFNRVTATLNGADSKGDTKQ